MFKFGDLWFTFCQCFVKMFSVEENQLKMNLSKLKQHWEWMCEMNTPRGLRWKDRYDSVTVITKKVKKNYIIFKVDLILNWDISPAKFSFRSKYIKIWSVTNVSTGYEPTIVNKQKSCEVMEISNRTNARSPHRGIWTSCSDHFTKFRRQKWLTLLSLVQWLNLDRKCLWVAGSATPLKRKIKRASSKESWLSLKWIDTTKCLPIFLIVPLVLPKVEWYSWEGAPLISSLYLWNSMARNSKFKFLSSQS